MEKASTFQPLIMAAQASNFCCSFYNALDTSSINIELISYDKGFFKNWARPEEVKMASD